MAERAAIILAAGKSTRMRSDLAKVLHEVCGQPILEYVIGACETVGVSRLVIVVGHGKEAVKHRFCDRRNITWIEQAEQKGTGHAALVCESELGQFRGPILVIAGDMPLVRPDAIQMLLDHQENSAAGVTLASSMFDNPTGYGRIVRDESRRLSGIVEEVDCSPEQKAISEVNISYYCFDGRRLFDTLHQLRPNNAKGEYYITDAVRIMIDNGHGAEAMSAVPQADAEGINSRADLARVNGLMQRRIQESWMNQGVTIIDPTSTWIEAGCEIGTDTTIHPFSHVGTGVRLGSGCRVGPFAHVAAGERILDNAVIGPVFAAETSVSS